MAKHVPFVSAATINLPLSSVFRDQNAHEAASSSSMKVIKSILPPLVRKDKDWAPKE